MRRRAIRTPEGPLEVTEGGVVIAGYRRSKAVMATWSDEQLAAIGVEDLAEAPAPPFGYRRVGPPRLEIVDDAIVEAFDLEPIPLAELKDRLLQAVRAKRWEVETAGIVVGGVRMATDEKGQAKIAGAIMLFDKSPGRPPLDWEASPGVFVAIDQVTAEAAGVAVGDHVQQCFTRSRELAAAIAAASDLQALSEIDINGGWPSTAAEGDQP